MEEIQSPPKASAVDESIQALIGATQGLIGDILKFEEDIEERARLAAIELKKREGQAKTEVMSAMAPTIVALSEHLQRNAAHLAANPEMQERIQKTVEDLAAKLAERGISIWEMATFCGNREFITEAEGTSSPKAAKALIERTRGVIPGIFEIKEGEYTDLRSDLSETLRERDKRSKGETFDRGVADRSLPTLLRIFTDGQNHYYKATSAVGGRILHALRRNLDAAAKERNAYRTKSEDLKARASHGVKDVILEGKSGSCVLTSYYAPEKGARGTEVTMFVLYNNENDTLKVEEMYCREGTMPVLEVLRGEMYSLYPDPEHPDFRRCPYHMRRFLSFALTNMTGWRYERPTQQEEGAANVVATDSSDGASNGSHHARRHDSEPRIPRGQRREIKGHKERGGGNARRWN